MKIIDFKRKGNVVRFYLGREDCEDYGGDDWDDQPYEHNAGRVYDEYIVGHRDITFPFDYSVAEPCDSGVLSSPWCKDDMKAGRVPCIVALEEEDAWDNDFNRINADSRAIRYYFGDKMNEEKK